MARNKKNTKRNPVVPNGSNMQYRFFDNHVVEAKLNGTEVAFAFENFLDGILCDTEYIRGHYGVNARLADTYYGRAYCNTKAGEVYDENVGKKLATSRCLSLFRQDFDAKIVALLEELHRIEARIFNRLRKSGKLHLYLSARTTDEFYNNSIRMPGQPEFMAILENCVNKKPNIEVTSD